MSRKQKERVRLTALNIFFIVLCFITLIPILYSLSVSLNGQNTLLSSDFSFIPKNFSLENYPGRCYKTLGGQHRRYNRVKRGACPEVRGSKNRAGPLEMNDAS